MPRLSPQMFLIRFIRILLSLPFVWVGLLSGMFQLPISIPLLQAAWWISADGQMAVNALSTMVKHERTEEALACAMVWMEKQPSAELAAYAGVLATITQTPGPDIARDMLERAKQFDKDKLGLVELLEFMIAQRFGPMGAAADCARRLESRNDLSPNVSDVIHSVLLWVDMLARRFDDVKQRAQFMLSIGESPPANLAMAALTRRDGDEIGALRHTDNAAKMDLTHRYYYRFLAAWAFGAEVEASEYLEKLREREAELADYAMRQVNAAGGDG
ncbi:MAG: hypothetical protein QGG25_11700 [Phycisphaerae bacterium]|nr:hypothetical protein [Phycisphaerae bacterium]